MDTYGHSTPAGTGAADPGHVRILNESWPNLDVARRLNDRPVDEQIAVRARIEFATGVEVLAGTACRWTGRHVRVNIDDARIVTYGVWLRASDVQRA